MSHKAKDQQQHPADDSLAGFRDTELSAYACRNELLPGEVFADLSWEIMLQLDQAERHGMTVRCAPKLKPAAARPSTAERYLQLLILLGLVEMKYSPSGPVLRLTDAANQKLAQIFDCYSDTDRIVSPSEQLSSLLTFTQLASQN
jgi:hypothetical protein